MIEHFAKHLDLQIAGVPDGFYDSFDFPTTGNNLTHPRTLGYIAKTLWALPGVASVGIDVHLNSGNGIKMQPDAVAFDDRGEPIPLVDYESPNSSDARVPNKDVRPFITWREGRACVPPYVVHVSVHDYAPQTNAGGKTLTNLRAKHYSVRYHIRCFQETGGGSDQRTALLSYDVRDLDGYDNYREEVDTVLNRSEP